MCTCISIRALIRFLLIAQYLHCNDLFSQTMKYWIVFVLGIFNVGSHFIEVTIALERLISILSTKNYETFFSYRFIITVVSLPYVLSTVATFGVLHFKLVPLMMANYILMGLLIFTFASLFILIKIRARLDRLSLRHKTLSERYQEFENLKTNKTMKWLAVFCIIHIAGATGIQIAKGVVLAVQPKFQEAYLTILFECLMHGIYSFCFFIFPFTFIFTIRQIRKRYYSLFPSIVCVPQRNRIASEYKEFVILSVTGEKLIHESNPNTHFDTLAHFWNQDLDKRK